MKLLVFAHTPPPHHGQSYMVQVMLRGLGGDCRQRRRPAAAGPSGGFAADEMECYHVNARLSRQLEDIGDLRIGKFFLLLGYCLQAIWCRFRYGVRNLYYIPAPGKRSALYRDWMVMFLCRPFFQRTILHWHAAGLAKWLETSVQIRARSLTYSLMKRVDLSIVLSRYNRADAEKILSRSIRVVSNGIPDPCPDFETQLLPRRQRRFAVRKQLLAGLPPEPEEAAKAGADPHLVRVLFLAHCTWEKGLFDAANGVLQVNQMLKQRGSSISFRLTVAGNFVTASEREDFERLLAEPDVSQQIQYLGFVSGEQKRQLLCEADLFCFPTYYRNENQPVNLIEAMAYGLPILTTGWRSIPELFPPNYPGLVNIRSPDQVALGLLALIENESGEEFRQTFLRQFTLERYLGGLAEAFLSVEAASDPAPVPKPARSLPPV